MSREQGARSKCCVYHLLKFVSIAAFAAAFVAALTLLRSMSSPRASRCASSCTSSGSTGITPSRGGLGLPDMTGDPASVLLACCSAVKIVSGSVEHAGD